MRPLIASALALASVVSLSASALAQGSKFNMPAAFGDVYEMKVGETMMHMQMVQDPQGGKWVIMSAEEVEKMMGHPLGKYRFTEIQ